VVHEPLVVDPVAATIDENGLLYVAEDADYPYRPAEGQQPQGRIRLLKDKDGDGFYEESHVFAIWHQWSFLFARRARAAQQFGVVSFWPFVVPASAGRRAEAG
jgi:hypothetical protein